MTDTMNLFPETVEQTETRIDAEIASLLLGVSGGPLGLTIDAAQRAVLQAVRYHRGRERAITIAEIRERTKLEIRAIKMAVRGLRINFRLPIGSSKSGGQGGYFVMVTPEDLQIWSHDVLDQIRAQAQVLKAVAGERMALEMLGQLSLQPATEAAHG